MKRAKHPVQPLVRDERGVIRFKANAIVQHLLKDGPFNMNTIAMMNFSFEDQVQFAQLIGYSLAGLGELDYVSTKDYQRAARKKVYDK